MPPKKIPSTYTTSATPQNTYSCHGLEPAPQCAPAPQLNGVAGERLAADPEHGDACEQRAQRDDIDGDGIHPRA